MKTPKNPGAACRLLTTIGFLFVTHASGGFAQQSASPAPENVLPHLRTERSADHPEGVLAVWDRPLVAFMLVGDRADLAKSSVVEVMQEIAGRTGLAIQPERTAGLMLIYDSHVMDDLRDHREKFLAAHIPAAIVDVLAKNAAAADWKNLCQTSAWTDESQHIIGGVLIAREAASLCVAPAIRNLFGLTGASSEAEGDLDLCVLYALAKRGYRAISDARQHFKEAATGCRS